MYSSFFAQLSACLIFSSVLFTHPAMSQTARVLSPTNDAIGVFPQRGGVADPVVYLKTRKKALFFVREERWQQALPLLQSLTSSYKDDGDTWYLLGLTQMQLGHHEQAIAALKNALTLGVNVTNIPNASRPSNDIMIKVSEAYAQLGNIEQAHEWLRKSLSARYDERSSIAGKAAFDAIKDNTQFQILAGQYKDPTLTRVQQWRADLEFLLAEINRLHINEMAGTNAELVALAKSLHTDIPNLNDQQIVFRMMELVGTLGNGHNLIVPTFGEKGNFSRLPVQFYVFTDGLYIVDATPNYSALIGQKVMAFEGTSSEEAIAKAAKINPRDNEMQQLWLAPYYLAMPEVLTGLGIADSTNKITITVQSTDNVTEKIHLEGQAFAFSGLPTLPKNHKNAPEYLQHKDKHYWQYLNKSNGVLQVQFNAVAQMKTQSLAQFSKTLIDRVKQDEVKHLVLDLRHNSGGNGSILPPLLKALIYFEAAKPDGKLFVIMGRNTFSAAQNLLTNINLFTDAILVGEPSGSRPNHVGEAGRFKLPYSGVFGLISSQFHQTSRAEDHRIWVPPHMPILPDSKSYFAGIDPAINAIYRLLDNL
ncbi:hypothetical protein [Pseudoalteromonas sp. PS5]|uniref:hypothetical protein n=1 Tax=Pseudoalteromonas sp. PS5 TaxID=1437473 RepID=UPI000FFE87CF|nr:hypothetical protein [Pseudoalteromonas sp. PS5]RXE95633.1 hypothetical protein D9603_20005 [Pseudoalteromonas sp. PS5]